MINTSAGPDEEAVVFSVVGAKLSAGPLQLGGEARHFGFSGSGKFLTFPGFGVFFSAKGMSGECVGWPDWIPVTMNGVISTKILLILFLHFLHL
jgi:hypothetical protein